jgi:hypothetical protein
MESKQVPISSPKAFNIQCIGNALRGCPPEIPKDATQAAARLAGSGKPLDSSPSDHTMLIIALRLCDCSVSFSTLKCDLNNFITRITFQNFDFWSLSESISVL